MSKIFRQDKKENLDGEFQEHKEDYDEKDDADNNDNSLFKQSDLEGNPKVQEEDQQSSQ